MVAKRLQRRAINRRLVLSNERRAFAYLCFCSCVDKMLPSDISIGAIDLAIGRVEWPLQLLCSSLSTDSRWFDGNQGCFYDQRY
jgi:hypothetical protein